MKLLSIFITLSLSSLSFNSYASELSAAELTDSVKQLSCQILIKETIEFNFDGEMIKTYDIDNWTQALQYHSNGLNNSLSLKLNDNKTLYAKGDRTFFEESGQYASIRSKEIGKNVYITAIVFNRGKPVLNTTVMLSTKKQSAATAINYSQELAQIKNDSPELDEFEANKLIDIGALSQVILDCKYTPKAIRKD